MFTISLPLHVPALKNPKFYLNLNTFRNAHFYTLNAAKQSFHSLVSPLLAHLPVMDRVSFTYVLFPKTRRDMDVANICSIVDKFFSDTFVTESKVIDDNYHYLPSVTYEFGSVDPINPRVDVIIRELVSGIDILPNPTKEIRMQISTTATIPEEEIASILEAHVRNLMSLDADQAIETQFDTNNSSGVTVVMNIQPMPLSGASTPTAVVKTKQTRRKSTPEPMAEDESETQTATQVEDVAQITAAPEDRQPVEEAAPVDKPKVTSLFAKPAAKVTEAEPEADGETGEAVEEVAPKRHSIFSVPAKKTAAE